MAAALEKVAGKEASGAAGLAGRTRPSRGWCAAGPATSRWERARGLGLKSDASFEAIVREYIAENPQAVRLSVR